MLKYMHKTKYVPESVVGGQWILLLHLMINIESGQETDMIEKIVS